MIVAIIIALLLLAYLFALHGRRNNLGLRALRGRAYAHRGLHGNGVPENSMHAFRLAKEKGYGVELDIHLMKDGKLAVIHDASLKRTANSDVKIEDLTAADLPNYRLEGTQEQIPLFADVLALFDGKVPLIVELKAERNNCAALCQAACDMLKDYEGAYCIESFDPRCIVWLRKNRPELVRGQLSENYWVSKTRLPWFLKLTLSAHLFNFLLVPDFIAYNFKDRKSLGTWLCRKLWGVQGVTWTIRSQEDFDAAVEEGWIPIFEGFEP